MPLLAFIVYCLLTLCVAWVGSVSLGARLDNMTVAESQRHFEQKSRNIRVGGKLFQAAIILFGIVSFIMALLYT